MMVWAELPIQPQKGSLLKEEEVPDMINNSLNQVDKRTTVNGDELQLVSFNIGSEEFGVDILKVQEINRMVEITKVPQAPHFVEGVINLRGKVIPIIDLRKRFGLEVKEYDKDTRIVVVDINGTIMGMIVDAVSEVLRLPSNAIEPPPEIVTGVNAAYIKGVARLDDRLLIFLDLSKVIDATELATIEN
jgi:purine-binding chemotaxis protein CheW